MGTGQVEATTESRRDAGPAVANSGATCPIDGVPFFLSHYRRALQAGQAGGVR
jgi:hypothetical protein